MKQHPFAIGVDIGGTNTEIGVVDVEGHVLKCDHLSSRCTDDFEEYIALVCEKIRGLIAFSSNDGHCVGIGVGAPNGNYYSGSVEYAPNLLWKGVLPIAEKLKSALFIDTVLTNDANAAAIGEGIYGGAKGMRDFVVITLGTGVGSGIVCNGELLYGHDGFAGEVGHTIVNTENGRNCGCGRKGCLETYTSATGIVRTARELLDTSPRTKSLLREVSGELTAKDLSIAANQGDEIALKVFDITANILGCALANLTAVLSPKAIFLSGGLIKAEHLLFDPLQHYYDRYLFHIFSGKTKISPSQLKERNAGVLGAAALAFKEKIKDFNEL